MPFWFRAFVHAVSFFFSLFLFSLFQSGPENPRSFAACCRVSYRRGVSARRLLCCHLLFLSASMPRSPLNAKEQWISIAVASIRASLLPAARRSLSHAPRKDFTITFARTTYLSLLPAPSSRQIPIWSSSIQ